MRGSKNRGSVSTATRPVTAIFVGDDWLLAVVELGIEKAECHCQYNNSMGFGLSMASGCLNG